MSSTFFILRAAAFWWDVQRLLLVVFNNAFSFLSYKVLFISTLERRFCWCKKYAKNPSKNRKVQNSIGKLSSSKTAGGTTTRRGRRRREKSIEEEKSNTPLLENSHHQRLEGDDDDDDDDESERKRAFRVLPRALSVLGDSCVRAAFFRGDDEETKGRASLLRVSGRRRRRAWIRYVVLIVRELSSRRPSLRDDLF